MKVALAGDNRSKNVITNIISIAMTNSKSNTNSRKQAAFVGMDVNQMIRDSWEKKKHCVK